MSVGFFFDLLGRSPEKVAITGRTRTATYGELLEAVEESTQSLRHAGVQRGSVVLLRGDFSPAGVTMLLALIRHGCICVPYTGASPVLIDDVLNIGEVEWIVTIAPDESVQVDKRPVVAGHAEYQQLRTLDSPGLVLFSSGSTGKSKGVVHDLSALLQKFRKPKHDLRTLAFLLFDHIGGLDTLFYCLSNASTLVVVGERTPEEVCRAIEEFKVEVLPTAPTFLNLLFLSGADQKYDLSSLKFITYGAEVMPQATLNRSREAFPNAVLLQKYGASEFGTMHSSSKSNDSLWMKIGGEGYAWRVVDGILQIKAKSAMIGYLNAPSPFTEDGWFITGDMVEVDGEYIRILGRKSDIINVGGLKVYPIEVEEEIRKLDNVADVVVFGKSNPLIGNIVAARVTLISPEPPAVFRPRLRTFLTARLDGYKVPSQIEITSDNQINSRFKRVRTDDTR